MIQQELVASVGVMDQRGMARPAGTGIATPEAGWKGHSPVIVSPLDGSIEAKLALPVARLFAQSMGATVHAFHASHEPLSTNELLRTLRLSCPEDTKDMVVGHTAATDPAEAIVSYAERWHAKLIVMTAQGLHARGDSNVPATPDRVLQSTCCPVLFTRPAHAPRIARMQGLRRILLTLDGALSTTAAIGPVISIAEKTGAELEVLYVVEQGMRATGEAAAFPMPRYVDQAHYEWPAWVQGCIDCLGALTVKRRVGVPTRVFVRRGDPESEILGFAAERDPELIVLAWHGRLDPGRAGVLRGVLETAPSPVLVLRAAPAEFVA